MSPVGRCVDVEWLDGGLFTSVAKVTLADGSQLAVKSSPLPGASTLLSY